MPIEAEVQKRARELADVIHSRRQSQIDKRAELVSQLIATDQELARADDAEQRLAAFLTKARSDVLCPYCWMYDKAERALVEAESPPDGEIDPGVALYRCEVCNNRYTGEPTD